MAAEMRDAFHAGDRFFDLREIGQIGGNEIVVGGEIGRVADIARANVRVDAGQDFAQSRADIVGGAGNENFLHRSLRSIEKRICASPFTSLHFCSWRSMLAYCTRGEMA